MSSYTIAGFTHRGAVRDRNEDVFAIDELIGRGDMVDASILHLNGNFHVLMVADGMGGHAHGELASTTAIETLIGNRRTLGNQETCASALLAANHRLYEVMQLKPETAGMGTTIVGAALSQNSIVHFNVGDSRAYRHSPGHLVLLSEDDVPGEPRWSGARPSHFITQSLGGREVHDRIAPHVAVAPPLIPGEALLLCSDGLTDLVSDNELFQVLEGIPEPPACARALLTLTFRAGAFDNVTILIARAE